MNYQKAVKAIVYVTVLAWTVCLLANHQTLQSGFLRLLLAANHLGEWAAASQPAVSLCGAPAMLDKAVEMKVNFQAAHLKGWR